MVNGEITSYEAVSLGEDRPETEDSDASLLGRHWYDVTVAARPGVTLHELDENVAGDYAYHVYAQFLHTGKDTALDAFHSVVPIKVLDNFDISVEIRS